jgi:hypothetical protein
MGFIFYISSRPASAGEGPPFLLFLLLPRWTWQWIYHGVAFGILTSLTYGAVRVSVTWPWPPVALVALAVALGYGGLDEWHQSFVPGRSAAIADVGRDAVGATAVILLARAAAIAVARLAHGQWAAFGRVSAGTLAMLEAAAAAWVTALWMVAGPQRSFSLAVLELRDFQTAVVQEPLALAVALPFLGVGLWIGLGGVRTLAGQLLWMVGPTLSILALLGIPFVSYGLDLLPDREGVWIATWVAAGLAWLLGLQIVVALRPR